MSVSTTCKRPLSIIDNSRPHHRNRVHSPSPSESDVGLVVNPHPHGITPVNDIPEVQPNNEAAALPPQTAEMVPDAYAPVYRRVRQPTNFDRLPENKITQWQRAIRDSNSVIRATNAKIKGSKASDLSKFMILALNAISRQIPVPMKDIQLHVEDARIPSVSSLLVRYPTLLA